MHRYKENDWERQGGRERERGRERDKERDTERERERERERETEREMRERNCFTEFNDALVYHRCLTMMSIIITINQY